MPIVVGDRTVGVLAVGTYAAHHYPEQDVQLLALLAAQVGIAGATTIEENVILWGQVGVSKTLTIGKDAVLYAQSGVPASLAGGKNYFGSPAEEAKTKMKELVWVKRIPEIWEKMKKDQGI